MQPHPRSVLIVAVLALVGSACTTAGRQLEGSSPDVLPFTPEDRQDQPVTEPTDIDADPKPSEIDPAVIGPEFEVSADGLTLAISGSEGIWWFDANGKAQLAVEPAIASDYDGSGGLVFQRSDDGPIVHRTSDGSETEIVSPGNDDRVQLIGVASINAGREAVYLRIGASSITLERTTFDGLSTTSIADVGREGIVPQRLSISNGYLSGVYLEGTGAGWVTLSLATGQKLFGTTDDSLGSCAEAGPGCARAVTIGNNGTSVYQVAAGDDPEEWELVVNDASNFAVLASVNLQRPAGGWHPTRLETAGDRVVVSRAANADGSGDIPALIVDPFSGSIMQLDRPGTAVVISG